MSKEACVHSRLKPDDIGLYLVYPGQQPGVNRIDTTMR
jgi:hypothetical protein